MAKSKRRATKRTVRRARSTWSFTSLGIIVVLLILALGWLVVMMRNMAEEQLQHFGAAESRTLEQISTEMDMVDVDVLDGQVQILDED